jgi:hypothetical protein
VRRIEAMNQAETAAFCSGKIENGKLSNIAHLMK